MNSCTRWNRVGRGWWSLAALGMLAVAAGGCGDDSQSTNTNDAQAPLDAAFDASPAADGAVDASSDGGVGPTAPPLQGYGTDSLFGGGPGAESCVVDNTDDDGPGSLRDCVESRTGPVHDPVPRTITFTVSGTITLLSDLRLRQPYLTIDGLSAPGEGITIAKQGAGEDGETMINTWPPQNTCGHDVLVQGLRFVGVWTRDTTTHSQNAGLLSVDGEDLPGCLRNVVIWRNVYVDGQDSAGTIWGSVTDLTFAYNLVLYCYHPQSISHWPGGEAGQERERLSLHHNVYAYATERIPNIRGNVWDSNVEQNVMHQWAALGLGSSYALQFRCRGGGCPLRINLIANHFTSSSPWPAGALDFNDNADPAEVFSQGNRFPPEETEDGAATAEFSRPAVAQVTLIDGADLQTHMLPFVGLPVRTAEETTVFAEVASRLAQE